MKLAPGIHAGALRSSAASGRVPCGRVPPVLLALTTLCCAPPARVRRVARARAATTRRRRPAGRARCARPARGCPTSRSQPGRRDGHRRVAARPAGRVRVRLLDLPGHVPGAGADDPRRARRPRARRARGRHLGRPRQRHARTRARVPAQAADDRAGWTSCSARATQLEPVWKAFGIQPQRDEPRALRAHGARRREGLQRIGFPSSHLTPSASRTTSPACDATGLPGLFDELSFGGSGAAISGGAGGVREGPRRRAAPHAHRRAARLGQDAARRRADPARRQARARARAQPGHPAAVAARGRAVRPPADVARTAGPEPAPDRVLTYQALCQLEDPEILLGRLAQSRWADERAAATGMSARRSSARARLRGRGRRAARARARAHQRRAQARGRARRARRRRAARPALRRPRGARAALQAGVGVVLLDECHHLASLWGYVVRAVLGELPARTCT